MYLQSHQGDKMNILGNYGITIKLQVKPRLLSLAIMAEAMLSPWAYGRTYAHSDQRNSIQKTWLVLLVRIPRLMYA